MLQVSTITTHTKHSVGRTRLLVLLLLYVIPFTFHIDLKRREINSGGSPWPFLLPNLTTKDLSDIP